MIRATLDTNVLASGAIATSGTIARLIDAAFSGRFLLIASEPIITELKRTLTRPYFVARLPPHWTIEGYVASLETVGQIIPITAPVHGIATHPEDDLVLATAVSGDADYLVTGDKGLLGVGSYEGVTIVTPGAFLEVLGQELL